MSDDLWGELPKANDIVHPKTVLDEQARILAKRTDGLLQGAISFDRAHVNYDTQMRFAIVCPTLQNYSFGVLYVYYNRTKPYPCEVASETGPQTANNVEDFKQVVASVLQSQKVRGAISALLLEVQNDVVAS